MIFTWEPKMGENHIMIFLYLNKITFSLLEPIKEDAIP